MVYGCTLNKYIYQHNGVGFEPMNPFTGLSLESSCFNHLHKRKYLLVNSLVAYEL